ncbi:MAG: HAMP domain-containing sensor histidine kinase [Hyphomicrobiales bacterium]
MGAGIVNAITEDPLVSGAVLAVFTVIVWALFVIRRMAHDDVSARRRIAELEHQLNEAEAAIAAEAHVLVVWRGRDGAPERVSGSMHGAAAVPTTVGQLLDFSAWLDRDSGPALAECVNELRASGQAFNIGVRTLAGELLEADGRTAGGFATLRFRPLSGERRDITGLRADAHKLGRQVERLSAVLDAAPLPIWLRQRDGKLAWVNQAYVAAVEAPDSSTAIQGGIEIASEQRLDRGYAVPRQGLVGRAHAVIGGAMRALNIHEIPLADGRAGFAIDMTALEVAEKELDRHIRAHASTLNKLDTAIAIFGPDQRLRFFNAAYAALWPLDSAWLETRPTDGEILDRLRNQRCIPEQANYRDWKAKQLTAYTTLETRETWWYLPDGRSVRVICEQHPFGGVTYLFENATREIQLESRYNELIGVQRETLDNLEEGVALFGSDGRLKLFNPAFARFWNLDTALLEQEPHIERLVEISRRIGADASAWDEVRFAITRLEVQRNQVNGKLATGERTLQYTAVPLPDGNTLLTFSDVSDAVRIERALRDRADALEAADRLKNMFLSNVSYEVRTPLTSVVGFAEGLQMGLAGPLSPKQKEYVQDIRRSSEELKTIIDAIIDLTAIDAGAMELKLERVDIPATLQAVAERLAPAIDKRDLTLNIEVAADVTSFIADPKRIEQILTNLLSNSIGFSTAGSTIRMGARLLGTSVQFWVSDTGRGIDPEFQKRVFERFQSRPVPGGHRGPGLGLTIVKSFVELHDGQVSLHSKVNQGTTVLCTFPLNGPRQQAGAPVPGHDTRLSA